ncbi:MAG: DinB family protein [Pseudomonadota bacterium]
MKAHFRMMAAYNAWANARLYTAAQVMSDEQFRADLGAFFGSVMATLNHIMVADLLWLARFRGQPSPPLTLDQILHEDLNELTAARKVLDEDICRFVESVSEEALEDDFTYRTASTNQEITQNMGSALSHVFNHQTHHRGQVHAMLTRVTGDAPALDLVFYQRDAA